MAKHTEISPDFESRMEAFKRSKTTVKTMVEYIRKKIDDCEKSKIDFKGKDKDIVLIEVMSRQLLTEKLEEMIDYLTDNDILIEEEDTRPHFSNENA